MNKKVVVTLSTIPPRFRGIGETINCILNQDFIPDEIQVYIPKTYRRFPQHSFTLPEIPLGGGRVVVKVVEADLGPATKVLYCAKNFWGTNTRIIYCDDDRIPAPTWLKSLIKVSKENPDKAIVSHGYHLHKEDSNSRFPRARRRRVIENPGYICKRIYQKVMETIFQRPYQKPWRYKFKRSGYVDIASGSGGVSINPEFFTPKAFNIPDLLWFVDDIWLSALLEYHKIGIWASNSIPLPQNSLSAETEALINLYLGGYDRNSANYHGIKFCQDNFSIWK